MADPFAVGALVTWGSGSPRARVVVPRVVDPDWGPCAVVALTHEIAVPGCGKVFPKGKRSNVPLDELRGIS